MPAEEAQIHQSTFSRSGYDVVVIGAGLIGLSCAWRASQAGMSVLVLERGEPACGASGVAAGMLAPATEAAFGEEDLLELNLRAREAWGGFAAELEELTGMPSGYAETGALVVAADRDDAEELRRLHAFQSRLGLRSRWLGARECRRLEPGLSPRAAGAILAAEDGRVDPRAVAGALVVALAGGGGEVAAPVEARSLEFDAGRVTGVRTADGHVVRAGAVLVAAGAWSSVDGLPTGDGAPVVRPVKGQLLELRARRPHSWPVRRVIRTPRCYIVTHADGRVVVGATVEEQGFDTAVTAEAVLRLLEAAREVMPDVGELELVAARAGLRPATPDNAPAIGRGAVDGLLLATGHYRNGVLLAPLTARAIAELLQGGEAPAGLGAFDPARFDAAKAV